MKRSIPLPIKPKSVIRHACPFLIGKMRLLGILPASVRILFPATPRRSPLRLRLGRKHAAWHKRAISPKSDDRFGLKQLPCTQHGARISAGPLPFSLFMFIFAPCFRGAQPLMKHKTLKTKRREFINQAEAFFRQTGGRCSRHGMRN